MAVAPNFDDGAGADAMATDAAADVPPAETASADTLAADLADTSDALDSAQAADDSDTASVADTALSDDATADTADDATDAPGDATGDTDSASADVAAEPQDILAADVDPAEVQDAEADAPAADVAGDTAEVGVADVPVPFCTVVDLEALDCASQGVCAGLPIAQCISGEAVCAYGAVPGYQALETACDGLDNDCDGNTDWMASAPPLAPLPGVCGLQLMMCGGSAGWQLPNPLLAPAYEGSETLCDGLDNDCDGLTDAGLSKANLNALGVCAAAPLLCLAGIWQLPDYAAANVAYEATETLCDGLDNDCDGLTDSLAGAPPAATLAQGVCAGQQQWCAGELGWQDPDPALIPDYAMGPEVSCDGLDNDCDGTTDEDAMCARWQLGGSGVGRLALSSDGSRLAWLTQTGVVWLDTASGAEAGADLGRTGPVYDVALAPGSGLVASAGQAASLRVVTPLPAASVPGVWPAEQNWTASAAWTALTWAPDGSALVAGDAKGSLWWWPSDQSAPLALPTHAAPVTAVAVATAPGQGSAWVVSGDESGHLIARPWPAGGAKTLANLAVPVLRLSSDGFGRIAVAAAGQPGKVFDVATGKLLFTLASPEFPAAVRFTASGLNAWGVGQSGTLYQWATPVSGGAADASPITAVAGPPLPLPAGVADLAIGPGVFYVAAVASGPWRLTAGSSTWQRLGSGHLGAVRDLSSANSVVLSAGSDGMVRRFASSGAVLSPLLGHDGPVLAVAGWPQGAITAGADYTVRLWTAADSGAAINYKTFGLGGPWAGDLAIVGDFGSCWAAAGSAALRVGLQGSNSTKKLQAWATTGQVTRLALSPTDDFLATATLGPGGTATYRVLAAATLTELWARSDLPGTERSVAWLGDRLALAGGPSKLVIVDATTGATLQELAGHTGEVTALAWHASSQRLLSGSLDGSVRIWSLVAGKPAKLLGVWLRHSPVPAAVPVSAVAWLAAPDGASPLAISASTDGAVMAWTAPQ